MMSTAYLIELFPFHARARGIAVYQWCSRGAGFFTEFVNPIGIDLAGTSTSSIQLAFGSNQSVGHGRLEMVHQVRSPLRTQNGQVLNNVSYCVWNASQVVFVYLMFPETSGRTLEELTFCECADAL